MSAQAMIEEYMQTFFDEVTPREFYKGVFADGELEQSGVYESGKYNAVAVELLPQEEAKKNKSNARRYIITDGMEILDKLLESENFIIVSPITYCGKSRQSDNARYIYAIAIDLDGVETKANITDLWHQINTVEYLPRPTYTVSSGNGLHLYYCFDKPIPCFKNITKQLAELKNALTRKIWNGYVTTLEDKVQIQSLFQGFRLVGGVTKTGSRTKAFLTGEPVTIDYLNSFVLDEYKVTDYAYKSKLTKSKAKELYPEWYEKRIEQGQKKGTWKCKRDLYDWWIRRLRGEIKTGHRYNGVMVLAIYAKKCGIDEAELEADAYGLLEFMDSMTVEETNHFTREDIMAALEMFNENYMTYPIDSIVERTNIPIQKNKRNFQKQVWHLEDMRSKKANMKRRGQPFKNPEGRPKGTTKQSLVAEWQRNHPEGKKADCIRDTGMDRKTVSKHWTTL